MLLIMSLVAYRGVAYRKCRVYIVRKNFLRIWWTFCIAVRNFRNRKLFKILLEQPYAGRWDVFRDSLFHFFIPGQRKGSKIPNLGLFRWSVRIFLKFIGRVRPLISSGKFLFGSAQGWRVTWDKKFREN